MRSGGDNDPCSPPIQLIRIARVAAGDGDAMAKPVFE
jgi:hypothetical protein